MRNHMWIGLALCAGMAFGAPAAQAASLSVSPTRLTTKGATAELTVRSGGAGGAIGQVRVMRVDRAGGKDVLTPTRDVAASPPALRLAPNQEMTVRLVRTAKTPVRGEECYRVLVDQLPGSEQAGHMVQFTIRHSVPLCFVN